MRSFWTEPLIRCQVMLLVACAFLGGLGWWVSGSAVAMHFPATRGSLWGEIHLLAVPLHVMTGAVLGLSWAFWLTHRS